jgi:very-short-patch-repair endonuclease
MGYPEYLVGVEYDGEYHWTDPKEYANDIERLEYLANAGWLIVRVSARQLRYDPAGVVERARRALQSRGYNADRTVVYGPTRDSCSRTVRSA